MQGRLSSWVGRACALCTEAVSLLRWPRVQLWPVALCCMSSHFSLITFPVISQAVLSYLAGIRITMFTIAQSPWCCVSAGETPAWPNANTTKDLESLWLATWLNKKSKWLEVKNLWLDLRHDNLNDLSVLIFCFQFSFSWCCCRYFTLTQ